MLNKILIQSDKHTPTPKEGDLYREVNVGGKVFRLLYGYYENFERESPFNEPIPIYPDFIKEPQYTEQGIPIVTAMQNICECYSGKNDEDSSCSDCDFFEKCEELFGLCKSPRKVQTKNETKAEKQFKKKWIKFKKQKLNVKINKLSLEESL